MWASPFEVHLRESYRHSILQDPVPKDQMKTHICALKFDLSLLRANVLGAVMF